MVKVFTPERILDDDQNLLIGKHRDRNIHDVLETDPAYCYWMCNQPWAIKDDKLMSIISKAKDPGMQWGKHKNKTLDWIIANDEQYIKFLKNSEYVKNNCKSLKEQLDKIDI